MAAVGGGILNIQDEVREGGGGDWGCVSGVALGFIGFWLFFPPRTAYAKHALGPSISRLEGKANRIKEDKKKEKKKERGGEGGGRKRKDGPRVGEGKEEAKERTKIRTWIF